MTLPVIGACLMIEDLETYRDWLIERQRDLELQSFHDSAVLDGDWQALVDRARALLDGHTGRLGIHGPFMGLNIGSSDPAVQAVVARRMDQALDICAALGATQMVIHSPYTPWDHANMDNFPRGRERIVECAHASIGGAVRRAADQGVTLVLENIQDVDPMERLRLVDSFGSEALQLSVDVGHSNCLHFSENAPPADYFISAAGNRLHHVHLQDTDGYADRHWALGEGTIRWPAIFRALEGLTSAPRLVLELRDKAGIPASIRLLTDLGLVEG